MTLALSYLDDLSRVRIMGTDLAPGGVTVERSINGLLWTTVRGGASVAVEAGGFTLDDYEFVPGRQNHYRIRAAVDEVLVAPSADQTSGDAWVVPDGVTSLEVDCIGAGGSAANITTNASSAAGGGAYAASTVAVTPGETLGLLVGAGGALGEDGGNTALIRGSTLLVNAPGGSGSTSGGSGGSATFPDAVGQVTFAGGNGGVRSGSTGSGGGGGAAASVVGPGGRGDDSVTLPGAFGRLGGLGGQAPGTNMVGRGNAWDVTDLADPHGPSLRAERAGLLVCAWSGPAPSGYTVPASMTQVAQQAGATDDSAVATEAIAVTGLTGVRTATGNSGFSWSAASALFYGPAVTVQGTVTDYALGGEVSATTSAASVGWWTVAVQVVGDTGPTFPEPLGDGWTRLADFSVTVGAPRTIIWTRQVTAAGPVTVDIGAPANAGDEQFLTVLLLSGVVEDTAVSGAGGTGGTGNAAGMDPGGNGAAPGGGGGGRASGSASSGLGAPGRLTLHSWETGVPESASITPVIDSIWLINPRYPLLNRTVEVVGWSNVTRETGTTLYRVSGRSTPVAVSDQRAAPAFELELLTTTAVDARDLDLTLTVGDTFLLQVPLGSSVPSGYIAIGDTDIERRSQRSVRRRHLLPCTVAAAPGPHIVASTLTWGTLMRLYGSWDALMAAHPTWADLMALVGSPDDVVVL